MKNKLAENMLRFGVKNLKANDIKKIEESILTEQWDIKQFKYPFKDSNQAAMYMGNENDPQSLKSIEAVTKLSMRDYADKLQLLNRIAYRALEQVAIEGIVPNPTVSINLEQYALKNAKLTPQDKAAYMGAKQQFSQNVNAFLTKWLPSRWKTQYTAAFPVQPNNAPSPVAPGM